MILVSYEIPLRKKYIQLRNHSMELAFVCKRQPHGYDERFYRFQRPPLTRVEWFERSIPCNFK